MLHANLSMGTTRNLKTAAAMLLALLLCATAAAQVAPSGYGNSNRLWVGAEYSNFLPDFGPPVRIWGVGVFGDWNLNPRWGVEGEARFLRFNGFYGEAQDNYLAGPRFTILNRGRFRPYAKLMLGMGEDRYPFKIGSGTYLAYVPGAGVDYHLSRRMALRAEYEYQFWPSAPGIPGEPSNGLKPSGFTVGFAYSLLGRRR